MKRFGIKPISFILVIAMILAMVFPASAGDAAVEFAFTCEEAVPGEELAVTLSVSSASTEVDGLIVYSLQYDTSVATFTGFDSYGELVTGSAAGTASVNANTKIINLGYSPAVVPNGKICVLKFQISETAIPGSEFSISMSAGASKNRVAVDGGVTAPSCTVRIHEETPVVSAIDAPIQIYGSNFTLDGKAKVNQFRSTLTTGTEHTIVYTGPDFLYWVDSTGMVLSDRQEYTFTFMNATIINAITANKVNGVANVAFLTGSGLGQVVLADTVAAEDVTSLQIPVVGDYPGNVFSGWTVADLDGGFDNTITSGDDDELYSYITSLINDGVQNINVKAYYETANADQVHSVKVIYDCDGRTTEKRHSVAGDKVKVFTADTTYLGQQFAGWYLNGELICPNLKYVVFVDRDITVTVKYSDNDAVSSRPVMENISYKAESSNGANRLVHITLHNVPDDYEVIAYGTIYSTKTGSADDLIIEKVDGSTVRKIEKTGSAYGLMTANINVGSSVSTVVNVRGYVTVRDSDGNVSTFYTEILTGSFNTLNDNGGNDSGSGGI